MKKAKPAAVIRYQRIKNSYISFRKLIRSFFLCYLISNL